MLNGITPKTTTLMESSFRTWCKLCADLYTPDAVGSTWRRANAIPLYLLQMNHAQLDFLLYLQKQWSEKSRTFDNFLTLMLIKNLPVPPNGNGAKTAGPTAEAAAPLPN